MNPHQLPSDAAVIAASCSDPPAFAAIFDRHWTPIERFCVVRAGSSGEDLAAEAFRVAFDQRKRYDGRDNARPWLYGIATNLLRGWFRNAARAGRAASRSADPAVVDLVEDSLGRVEAERLAPELAAILATLSATDRDALLLYALAELTYEEIARATEVPVGTVRSRIHRARSRVRTHLDALEVCR